MKKKLVLRVFTLLMACILSFGLLACLSGCNKVTGKPFVVDGVTYQLSHWANANDEWIALHILDCGGQTEITLPTMYEDTVIESFGGFYSNDENATTEGLDKVKTLVVPEGYKVLRSGACKKMINLESLILPQSLEKIESYSISGPQRLRTLTLPSNLKEIDYEAFANKEGVSIVEICNLSSLELHYSNMYIYSVEGASNIFKYNDFVFAYDGNKTVYLLEYLGGADKVILPVPEAGLPDVKISYKIADYAFAHRDDIKEIVIDEAYTGIGASAFADCPALKTITYKGDWEDMYKGAYWCDDKDAITIVDNKS